MSLECSLSSGLVISITWICVVYSRCCFLYVVLYDAQPTRAIPTDRRVQERDNAANPPIRRQANAIKNAAAPPRPHPQQPQVRQRQERLQQVLICVYDVGAKGFLFAPRLQGWREIALS